MTEAERGEREALLANWGRFVDDPWPTGLLVLRKALARGLDRSEVARLAGGEDRGKTWADLDGVVNGVIRAPELWARLMEALDITPAELEAAWEANVERARRLEREEEHRREMAERVSFRPHAWVIPERARPSPIFAVAWGGESRFRRVDLPADISSRPEVEQFLLVRGAIREHYLGTDGCAGPFGGIIGYLYRPTYDETVEFTVGGEVVERPVPRPRHGNCNLRIGNKMITNGPAGRPTIRPAGKRPL
jgi:hypothetical protein